jgi:DNA replication protein DnaC
MSHLPRFKVTLIGGIQFIEGLRNLYSTNGSVNDYFRSMTQGPLFIDDIGKEYVRDESSGWAEAQYHRLIDHCYVHRLPLMLTSNLDVDGLLARIGGAAASRLIEMCGPNARGFVDMSAAPDYRVSQGQ